MKSSNSFFCPNNSLKYKDSFIFIKDTKKQQMLTFKILHQQFFLLLFEKWLKRLLDYQNSWQFIFYRLIIRLITAALLIGGSNTRSMPMRLHRLARRLHWGVNLAQLEIFPKTKQTNKQKRISLAGLCKRVNMTIYRSIYFCDIYIDFQLQKSALKKYIFFF